MKPVVDRKRAGLPTPQPTAIPLGSMLAISVDAHWKAYRRRIRKARRELSAGAVHAARVQTRRLMAALELAGVLANRQPVAEALAVLKDRLRWFRALRDVQVQHRFVGRLSERHPPLRYLVDRLKRRQAAMARRLGQQLERAKRGDAVENTVASVVDALQAGAHRPAQTARWTRQAIAHVGRAYAAAMARKAAIDPESPETIHRVRVAFKRFRYAAETLPGALHAVAPDAGGRRREFQDRMGAIQDTHQLRRRVDRLIRKRRVGPELGPFLKFLDRRQRRLTAGFMRQASAMPPFWPAASSPRIRGRVPRRPRAVQG